MSASRRKRAEELFQVAVDLPAGDRTDYLRGECGSDETLRTDVDRLLEAFDRDLGDFLSPPRPHRSGSDEEPSPPPDRRTAKIGHYRIERELGRGGMGMVYLALDEKLGRHVAIKLLPDEFSHDPARVALFRREARTAAHLNHPNIATIYELGEFDGSYFIAMEYVEGCLLSALLERPEPVALREILDIATQIAEGLTAAHDRNVVHRDLKPGNLMITGEGRVKILDFGLAKALQSDVGASVGSGAGGDSSASSTCFGTIGYSSPEQCTGDSVDTRADLFSFGVVLYELATGKAPFKRPTAPETVTAVLEVEPPPLASVKPELPVELGDVIASMLAKRPGDRCESSADVLLELEAIRRGVEGRPPSRLTKIALVTAIVALAVAGWILMSNGDTPAADPLFAQASGQILRGEIPEARVSLARLEETWGDNEELRVLSAHLRTRIDELIGKGMENLNVLLSAGELERTRERVEEICRLDEEGRRCGDARSLLDEAQGLHARMGELVRTVVEQLGEKRFDDSWQTIGALEQLRFRSGAAFEPAEERAVGLRERLVGELESEAEALLASRAESVKPLEALLGLLGQVDASSAYIPRLREGVAAIRMQELAGHRDMLRDEMAREAGRRSCARIEELCDLRRLGEAKLALKELENLGIEGLDRETSAAGDRVQKLERENDEVERLEGEFARFRRLLLQSRSLPDARSSLEELEIGWSRERDWLGGELKSSPELLGRRAVLNLRLGAWDEARRDAEGLETADGWLLRAVAGIALAGEDATKIREALLDVEQAIEQSGSSARSLYVRAACAHILARTEESPEHLGQARADLNEAVAQHGLDSADAHHRLATIYVEMYARGAEAGAEDEELNALLSNAIASATEALRAPLTEDEIVVAFGGNRGAVGDETLRRFRRDVLLGRAEAHFVSALNAPTDATRPARYGLCIDDCSKAIELDDTRAYSYFLRGWAEGEVGRSHDALVDLRRALDLSPADSTDPQVTKVRTNAPLLIDRFRSRP
ncbi:MAG: protein kinase domain-containing protein [Planctomycetota bacterium]|jgi:serine/threonine protein kinase